MAEPVVENNTNKKNAALDEAATKIRNGAWWHGIVDYDGPRVVIELTSEPDERNCKWNAYIDEMVEIEGDTFGETLAWMAAQGIFEAYTNSNGETTYAVYL